MNRILIAPPLNDWYLEAHAEYLIRYLGDEFFMEIADIPYEPYTNFISRFPETNPHQRSPDDYDLIWPLLPSHWVITDKDKYAHKVATVFFQPGEGRHDVAVVGGATPIAERGMPGEVKMHSLRFGVDIDMFKPFYQAREDKLLHVGMLGNLYNPRRMVPDIINALKDLPGVRLMLFLNQYPRSAHDLDLLGGPESMKYIVTGNKMWCGLPNIYNRMDVLIRADTDPGYSFPVLEAAACGVPVIATDQGIDNFITDAGGGILIKADEKDAYGSGRNWYQANQPLVAERIKEAVIQMRDNQVDRQLMAIKARQEIIKNWQWPGFIPAWKDFFREGLEKAYENSY